MKLPEILKLDSFLDTQVKDNATLGRETITYVYSRPQQV